MGAVGHEKKQIMQSRLHPYKAALERMQAPEDSAGGSGTAAGLVELAKTRASQIIDAWNRVAISFRSTRPTHAVRVVRESTADS